MIGSIDALVHLMREHGAARIYAKKMAPNDNSKNQVYLGGDFSVLNIIPHGQVTTDGSDLAGSVRDRAKAKLRFSWMNEAGRFEAPDTQLILYPKYPEVRMSGFLKGCPQAPSEVMRVRDENRVLFIGITNTGEIIGYAAGAGTPLANELIGSTSFEERGVFLEIPVQPASGSTKDQLLAALTEIYQKHWIRSQKLGANGVAVPYNARNGGGYTLEAELGITPNGYAEPDFLGWEIKQYGVRDFRKYAPKSPVTLMTPEPTGGVYRDDGVEAFLHRYGYADKSGKAGRINFGGIYACNRSFHADTGLQLRLTGYNEANGKIVDMTGGVILEDAAGEVAAKWGFTGMIEHWNRKHAQAAYVPSLFQTPPPEYRYGPKVQLCEQTDFSLLLKALATGNVYYDPGIKIEGLDTGSPTTKRRSQFRIKHSNLGAMYHHVETVALGTG
jgi:hypothetical protein